ncbi:MAG: TIR domain-containing protein, partial [Desulfobacterales bacterium]
MTFRILVIEDEKNWREQFEEIFEIMGHEVDSAQNVDEAKKLLNDSNYDLVLLDVCLRGDGITIDDEVFWEELNKEYPDVPVIAVTGWRLTLEKKLKFIHFVDFIYKPALNLKDFRSRIHNALPSTHHFQSPTNGSFKYDVFISYSHHDIDWVQNRLIHILKFAGIYVCIDSLDFEPGAPSLTEMERAVLQSRKTILVLTPYYIDSEWAQFENILAQTLDPTGN